LRTLGANTADGAAKEDLLDAKAFRFHPNNEQGPTGVAVCPINLAAIFDSETGESFALGALSIPLNRKNECMSAEQFTKEPIGLGRDIAIVGLFRSRYGTNRKSPNCPCRNIAASISLRDQQDRQPLSKQPPTPALGPSPTRNRSKTWAENSAYGWRNLA
jgi:hypothetical protein